LPNENLIKFFLSNINVSIHLLFQNSQIANSKNTFLRALWKIDYVK